MNYKSFGIGFALCYAIAGIVMAKNASEIPATTTAGAMYAGVMWMPLTLLPQETAFAIVPSWAFDFENTSA